MIIELNGQERDAKPSELNEGWAFVLDESSSYYIMRAVRQQGDNWFAMTNVVRIVKPRHTYQDELTEPQVEVANNLSSFSPLERMREEEALVLAEMVGRAVRLCHAVKEDAAKQFEEERERREREREERRKAQEQRQQELAEQNRELNAWHVQMQEELQWQLGSRLRLLRWNKRATVFGMIDDVALRPRPDFRGQQPGSLRITTERGKPMQLGFQEIEVLEIYDEDERAYVPLQLPLHPHRDKPEPRSRRAITGSTGRVVEA